MSGSVRIFHVTRLSTYNRALPVPLKAYKTNLVWFGSKVLNPIERTFREYGWSDIPGNVILHDLPFPNHLSRVDYVDPVDVLVYSRSMWAENDVLFIESGPVTAAAAPTGPLR